jgi:excisionase family DNA binding protein
MTERVEYDSVRTCAERLKISETTVRRGLATGVIPSIRLGGKILIPQGFERELTEGVSA